MFVVVGHGPSVMRRAIGPLIDSHTVIRLKGAPTPDVRHFGCRTDIVCAKHAHQIAHIPGAALWLANHPNADLPDARTPDMAALAAWWTVHSTRKATTGLLALYMLAQFLPGAYVGVIGFDALLHPKSADLRKWTDDVPRNWPAHDRYAENRAMRSLNLKVIDLDADL